MTCDNCASIFGMVVDSKPEDNVRQCDMCSCTCCVACREIYGGRDKCPSCGSYVGDSQAVQEAQGNGAAA